MAVDKLVDSTVLDANLTAVANAIRTKGGTSAQLAFPAGFVQAIGDIETGSSEPTIPDDENLHVMLNFPEESPLNRRVIRLRINGVSSGGSYTIDWGDGSERVTYTAASGNITHTYNNSGVYLLSVYIDGTITVGGSSGNYGLIPYDYSKQNPPYNVIRIICGNKVSLTGTSAFGSNLNNVVEVRLPSLITAIPKSLLNPMPLLTNVDIPSTVTSMGATALGSMRSVSEIHCKPTAPPTIESNTFDNLPSDCTIYVPYSADHSILNAYKAATNWSAQASKIQEEAQ